VTPTAGPQIGRNEKCPCGSGRKYKQCCLGKDEEKARKARAKDAEKAAKEAEKARKADKPAKRRLSTAERWRGRPYLRAEDSLPRGEALNRALPPNPTNVSQGSLGGSVGLRSAEAAELRRRALDMALPEIVNPIMPGGF